MPVTVSGDATKRIEALVSNLSDDRMRELTVQLRDSLVRRLWNVQWSGKTSILIGRGLTAYTEPVRTPTGGWMCGVGSLDILHREDAPPKTISQFLYWYQTQYMPKERAERRAVAERRREVEITAKRRVRVKLDLRKAHKARRSLEERYSDLVDSANALERRKSEMIASDAPVRDIERIEGRLRTLWNKRIPKAAERVRESRKRIDRLMTERQLYYR
jgi:hypothetical protein